MCWTHSSRSCCPYVILLLIYFWVIFLKHFLCARHNIQNVACIHPIFTKPDEVNSIIHFPEQKLEFQRDKVACPGAATGEEPACQCRRHKRHGLIPGSGRSPGEGIGNPLWYSCLENPRDRRAWLATVHSVAKSPTWLKHLSTHAHLKSFRQETEFNIKFIWLQSCVSCIDE